MKRSLTAIMGFVVLLIQLTACKKQDEWLDVKYNKGDIVPKTLKDYQAILDNNGVMNAGFPIIGFAGTDNFYLTTSDWQTEQYVPVRNAYIWAKDIFESQEISLDWLDSYRRILYSNVVLDGLMKLPANSSNEEGYNNVKGSALFYRAYNFYTLAQLYSKPYSTSAATDPGIPLRLSADVNIKAGRGTVAQTYEQVLNDLKEAEQLLTATSLNKFRPSRPAVYGALARVYLNMEDYPNAELYADKLLTINNNLIDFNPLSISAIFPFPNFSVDHPEVVFHAFCVTTVTISARFSPARVDSTLFALYAADDLRKDMFFRTATEPSILRGSYTGNSAPFAGIATNEMFLISAECKVRRGEIANAVSLLNQVLEKRWKKGRFIPFSASDKDAALHLILTERRKELPFTGQLPWEDLRRLNKDPKYARTLTRVINGTTYTLPPNDPRYVLPIPNDEIRLNGLEQNPR